MAIRDTLATRLRDLMSNRISLNTQTKVAAKAMLSQSTINRILNQDVAATIDALQAIADAFGIQPADLLSGEMIDGRVRQVWTQLSPENRSKVWDYAVYLLNGQKDRAPTLDLFRE